MILECPACHARYLVQISLFAAGGRQVRCARCKHQWHEALPTSIDVFVPLSPPPRDDTLTSLRVETPRGPPSHLSPSPPSSMPSGLPSTHASPPSTGAENLPAVIKTWNWRQTYPRYLGWLMRVLKVAVVGGAILIWPIVDRQKIVVVLPELRGVYALFGLDVKHSGEGLVFDQVNSELRYDSGAMRLVVDGVVRNTTQDKQIIPDIKARAIGADNHIIQSWWIAAPAATVAAASDVPFHTEVNASPASTIENVYLEFYAQDEKRDGVK